MNTWFGYRTPSSKKNADMWAEANSYSSKLVIAGGMILTVIGLISLAFPNTGLTGRLIGAVIILLFVTILFIATEIHLNKIFDKNGNRRN